MANITTSKITDTSMTVYLENLDKNYGNNPRTCKWYIMKNDPDSVRKYLDSMTLANKISYSQTYEITSLESNTEYIVDAVITAEGWTNPKEIVLTNVIKTKKSSTDPGPDPGPDPPVDPEPPPEEEDKKIDPFKWSDRALEAFNTHGPTSELTAEEWNTLVDKVAELYKGFKTDEVKADLGDWIKASKFNKIADQVLYKPDNPVAPGAVCYGKHFIELVEILNKRIEAYSPK